MKVEITDLNKVLNVVMPMMKSHYKEISHLDGEFSPDVDNYLTLNKMGLYVFITATIEGDIVGYAGYFKNPHHHNSKVIHAFQDMIYLDPEYRGAGLGTYFINQCDKILKGLGAEVVINAVSHKYDFGLMLEKLGYTLLDKLYARRL